METMKNVIIFDGINEYSNYEIFQSLELENVYHRAINLKGLPTLIKKINEENGLLHIKINSKYEIGRTELKNVSLKLQDEYIKIIGL
jgi:hypothetical protein